MAIKCVILEDEVFSSKLMEDYISKNAELELLGKFVSPIDFIESDVYHSAELIYLDIQMPEMSGIDFLKQLSPKAEIIITTANPNFALEGFRLNLTDYLMKPIEYIKFIQATSKAIEKIKLSKKLLEANTSNKEDGYLFLKVDKKQIKIYIKNIVYIEGAWNYIIIHSTSQQYIVHEKMKVLESRLSQQNFLRIHKSYIVNIDFLEFIEGNLGYFNGKELPISRSYKANLIESVRDLGL
ncbi:MAG: LytR/AlgR family response regulator transcription factor [Flavobacteriales bacterium]